MLKFVIFFVFVAKSIVADHTINKVLIDNFFDNLEATIGDVYTDLDEKAFVDEQINNFLSSFKKEGKKRFRRSTEVTSNAEDKGIPTLDGVTPFKKIEAFKPKEIILFEQNSTWYSAVLEQDAASNETVNLLTLHKYDGMSFDKMKQIKINNGIKIATYKMDDFTLLVLAEYNNKTSYSKQKFRIFQFGLDEEIYELQNLCVEFATDALIWSVNEDIFMMITQEKIEKNNTAIYQLSLPVYKWLGGHFSQFGQINTRGAKKVTAFSINNHHYLAVANFQNDKGETRTYSEVYKFDFDQNQYVPHQKLLTSGAMDVKHFCIRDGYHREHFLAIANAHYSKDSLGSIIYKFVDGYFLPFHAVTSVGLQEFLPVIGGPEEFALLMVTQFGEMRALQYDGWKFIEANANIYNKNLKKNIASINFYKFLNESVVTVANWDHSGNDYNLFKLEFVENVLEDSEVELLEFCRASLEELESFESAKSEDTQRISLFAEENFEDLASAALRAENSGAILEDDAMNFIIDKLARAQKEIKELSFRIVTLKGLMDQYRVDQDINKFEGTIIAKHVKFNNNDNHIHNLTVELFNREDIGTFLENVIYINEQNFIDFQFEATNLEIENLSITETINEKPVESYLRNNHNLKSLPNIRVKGNVEFEDGIYIPGLLNNIKISHDNILLKSVDQNFKSSLRINNLKADKVEAKFLNKLNLNNPIHSDVNHSQMYLENLEVEDLVVEGKINNIDFNNLYQDTLKKSGNQEMIGTQVFEKLYTKNLEIKNEMNNLSIPDDLVLIDEGIYNIKKIGFGTDSYFNNVHVVSMINTIEFENGKADLLLKNSSDVQYISSFKSVNNIILHNPIKLLGKPRSESLEKHNPSKIVERKVTVKGDVTIFGNVTIEKILRCRNIRGKSHQESLQQIQGLGLKLTEENVPVKLNFAQQLNVGDLSVDTINEIDTKSWIEIGKKNKITGLKRFPSNVFITGNTVVHNVNSIDLFDLENNTLNVDGDQFLSTKITFENLIENNFDNKNIKIGNKSLEEILSIQGRTAIFEEGLFVNELHVENLNISGKVNSYDITNMIQDTAFKTFLRPVSNKFIEKLEVDDLEVRSNYKLQETLKSIKDLYTGFTLTEDIVINQNFTTGNLTFKSDINGISTKAVEHNFARTRGDIPEDTVYDKISILGNCTIASNKYNHINMQDFLENSVKLDEDFSFDFAVSDTEVVSPIGISLGGQLEDIDISNIITQNKVNQAMFDKVFRGDVIVDGILSFNGMVNGLNLTNLCDYLEPEKSGNFKHLYINGSAHFLEGVEAEIVNELSMSEVVQNGWLASKELEISKLMKFGDVQFEEEVFVDGYTNGISLEWLNENIFTLNTDQKISANLKFKELVFKNGVTAKEASVEGKINNINLDEFMSTTLLDGVDQTYESTLFVGTCVLDKIQGNFSINGLDIDRDILSYDKENIFVEQVRVKKLIVENLTIKLPIKIQSVPILDWLDRAVLNNGKFDIKGTTTFTTQTVFEKALKSPSINGLRFVEDEILLRNRHQNISGRKIFNSNVEFSEVELTGLINGVNIKQFAKKLASKENGHQVLVNSDMKFEDGISARNLDINKLYNGVNISNTLKNMKEYESVNNFSERHGRLLDVAKKVSSSLDTKAFYLKYYKELQEINCFDMFPISIEGNLKLLVVHAETDHYVIEIYQWLEEVGEFSFDADFGRLKYGFAITSISPLVYEDDTLLLIENRNPDASDPKFIRNVFRISKNSTNSYNFVDQYPTSGLIESSAFTLTERKCYVSIEGENYNVNVYCQNTISGGFEIIQDFNGVISNKIATFSIEEKVYIFISNYENTPEVWKFDEASYQFYICQTLEVNEPQHITTILHRNKGYVAISSGRIQSGIRKNIIHIKSYNFNTEKFVDYQDIEVNSVRQLEFQILPSEELALFVLTTNPSEPLVTYLYKGISGFTPKITTLLHELRKIQPFNSKKDHFVLAKTDQKHNILKGVFT